MVVGHHLVPAVSPTNRSVQLVISRRTWIQQTAAVVAGSSCAGCSKDNPPAPVMPKPVPRHTGVSAKLCAGSTDSLDQTTLDFWRHMRFSIWRIGKYLTQCTPDCELQTAGDSIRSGQIPDLGIGSRNNAATIVGSKNCRCRNADDVRNDLWTGWRNL